MISTVELASGLAVLSAWWHKAKRRPARFFRSYLDICILTQQNRSPVANFEGMHHLEDCAGVWKGDKGGPKRPVGCGDRVRCPLCADYYHGTQAREGIATVDAVLDGCVAAGVSRDSWGDRIELTLPKALSESLDALSQVDTEAFRDKINKLRQAAWRCVGRAVSRACADQELPAPGQLGGVMVLHHWGSSAPWQPHYHFHVYLLPYTADYAGSADGRPGHRDLVNWRALPHWWSKDSLALLRSGWKKAAQRVLGEHYAGHWNVHRSFCGKRREYLHFMAYQMRAPLRDLWKGLRGDVASGFEYHAKGKRGQPAADQAVSVDDFGIASGRARLVGTELQRITWYGLLANICQSNTMRELGLVQAENIDEGDGVPDKSRYWRPVDTTTLGVLFESTDGSKEVDFVAWDSLRPYPVAGPCDKPIGARRRHRWFLPPGKG